MFGYTKLYGQVPGGQAELLRVPHADYGPIKVPDGPARRPVPVPVRRAADGLAGGRSTPDVAAGGSLVVLGLGPIGDMACRVAAHRGVEQVIGIDLVPERLERAASARGRRARSRPTFDKRRRARRRGSAIEPAAAAPTR